MEPYHPVKPPRPRNSAATYNRFKRVVAERIAGVFSRERAIGIVFGINRRLESTLMRDDYLQAALKVVGDPSILVNVVSRRVKQLRRGNRPLVESLEKMSAEDTALREVAEGKISYELATPEELARR